ncbi:MAG: AbrB/MazE/SpoVT family DNA-binding domain-containing protein [Anaerolineae bacterium]|nr:AbrB/MazE/SpoVT family DNA-binding domain-containing protein [Anaerolineae bacterium]
MKVVTAQVSSKYQVVLPKEVRVALGIHPRTQVLFLIDGDRVYLRPRPTSFSTKLRGLHSHVWRQGGEDWLAKERASWEE